MNSDIVGNSKIEILSKNESITSYFALLNRNFIKEINSQQNKKPKKLFAKGNIYYIWLRNLFWLVVNFLQFKDKLFLQVFCNEMLLCLDGNIFQS